MNTGPEVDAPDVRYAAAIVEADIENAGTPSIVVHRKPLTVVISMAGDPAEVSPLASALVDELLAGGDWTFGPVAEALQAFVVAHQPTGVAALLDVAPDPIVFLFDQAMACEPGATHRGQGRSGWNTVFVAGDLVTLVAGASNLADTNPLPGWSRVFAGTVPGAGARTTLALLDMPDANVEPPAEAAPPPSEAAPPSPVAMPASALQNGALLAQSDASEPDGVMPWAEDALAAEIPTTEPNPAEPDQSEPVLAESEAAVAPQTELDLTPVESELIDLDLTEPEWNGFDLPEAQSSEPLLIADEPVEPDMVDIVPVHAHALGTDPFEIEAQEPETTGVISLDGTAGKAPTALVDADPPPLVDALGLFSTGTPPLPPVGNLASAAPGSPTQSPPPPPPGAPAPGARYSPPPPPPTSLFPATSPPPPASPPPASPPPASSPPPADLPSALEPEPWSQPGQPPLPESGLEPLDDAPPMPPTDSLRASPPPDLASLADLPPPPVGSTPSSSLPPIPDAIPETAISETAVPETAVPETPPNVAPEPISAPPPWPDVPPLPHAADPEETPPALDGPPMPPGELHRMLADPSKLPPPPDGSEPS